jgi:hypothetical protein
MSFIPGASTTPVRVPPPRQFVVRNPLSTPVVRLGNLPSELEQTVADALEAFAASLHASGMPPEDEGVAVQNFRDITQEVSQVRCTFPAGPVHCLPACLQAGVVVLCPPCALIT